MNDFDPVGLGRLGGLRTVARHGPHAVAARARAGLRARFLREADPDGELPDTERERRAALIMRAHYAKMSLASAKARRRRQRAE